MALSQEEPDALISERTSAIGDVPRGGLTPDERQALFGDPSPPPPPKRTITQAIEEPVSRLSALAFDTQPEAVDQAGLAAWRAKQQDATTRVTQRRAELGRTGEEGLALRSFDAAAAGMAGAVGAPLTAIGRWTGLEKLEQFGQGIQEEAAALMPQDPGWVEKIAAGAGSTLSFFVPGMGVGAAAGKGLAMLGASVAAARATASGAALLTATGLESAGVAQEAYESAMDATGDPKVAEGRAVAAGLLSAPIVFFTDRLGIFGDTGNALKKLALTASTEGLQEGSQRYLTNVAGYKPAGEGIVEDAIIGAAVGGGVKGMQLAGERYAQKYQQESPSTDPRSQDVVADLSKPIPPEELMAAAETNPNVRAALALTLNNLNSQDSQLTLEKMVAEGHQELVGELLRASQSDVFVQTGVQIEQEMPEFVARVAESLQAYFGETPASPEGLTTAVAPAEAPTGAIDQTLSQLTGVQPELQPVQAPAPAPEATIPAPAVEAPVAVPSQPVAKISGLESVVAQLESHFKQAVDRTTVTDGAPDADLVKMAQAVKDAYGTEIVWIQTPEGGAKLADGKSTGAFYGLNLRDQNAIAVNLTRPKSVTIRNTIGHELTHQLKTKHPEIYRALETAAMTHISRGGKAQIMQGLQAQLAADQKLGANVTAEQLTEIFGDEAPAEITGELWDDAGFWDVAFKSAPDAKFAKRMMDAIKGLLDRIQRAFMSSGFVRGAKDINAMRTAAAEAFKRWEQAEATPAPAKVEKVTAKFEKFQRPVRPESDIGHKREITSGRYIGAPKWVGSTPQQLIRLRSNLGRLQESGKAARYWYENSSKAILDMFGGNKKEAERFVALLAIYSQDANVAANTTMALNAHYQWQAGQKIKAHYGRQDAKAQALMDKGEYWSGIKTNNFYVNLMAEIDPSKVTDEATMDVWMKRAFEYESVGGQFGPAQYAFMLRETQRLATEIGWTPHQAQAAIWTGIKSKTEGIAPETAGYSFAEALRDRSAQLSWEAQPGETVGVLPKLQTAPIAQKLEYFKAVMDVLYKDGVDLIAQKVGMPHGTQLTGFSAWKSNIGIGGQVFVPVRLEGQGAQRRVGDVSRRLLNRYSALKGYILSQEAVVWHHPIYNPSAKSANGYEATFTRGLTADEMSQLYAAINKQFGTWDLAPGYTPLGVRVLNFTDTPNSKFQSGMESAMATLPTDFGGGMVEHKIYRSDGEYISNDWQEAPHGQQYLEIAQAETGEAGRPALQEWADGVRARVETVNRKFSEKYNWGEWRQPQTRAKAEVDLRQQSDWLQEKAVEAGFSTVDEWLASNPESFWSAAAQWRKPAKQRELSAQFQRLLPPSDAREMFANIGRSDRLSPQERAIETRFALQLALDYYGAVDQYKHLHDSQNGKVLNVDTARELSPDYEADRTKSVAVHEPASWFIKRMYRAMLAAPLNPGEERFVFFTAGGTGAGKSSVVKAVAKLQREFDVAHIVYDTNMNTYKSAKVRVEQALDAGYSVYITLVVRDPVDALVNGALPRAMRQEKKFGSGRTVPIDEHVNTHIGAIEVAQRLAKEYASNQNVAIDAIDNRNGHGGARPIELSAIRPLIYNEVEPKVRRALEDEYEKGNISEAVYKGFAKTDTAAADGEIQDVGPADEAGDRRQPQPERQERRADQVAFQRSLQTTGTRFTLKGESTLDRLQTNLQDQFVRIRNVQNAVETQGGVVTEASNVYKTEERFRGRAPYRLQQFKEKTIEPLLARVGKAGLDLNDIGLYMYAMHAPSRNTWIAKINPLMPDGGSGIKNTEAAKIIATYRNDPNFPKIDALAKELWAITKDTQQVMIDGGLVTPTIVAGWNARSSTYVPLKGFEQIDELGNTSPGIGRGFDVRGAESRRAMGRETKAGQIVENIIFDHEKAIVRSEKNTVAKALLNFVLMNPDPRLWQVDKVEAMPAFYKGTLNTNGLLDGEVRYMQRVVKDPERTVMVKHYGQEYAIWLKDPSMIEAMLGKGGLMSADAKDANAFIHHWRGVNRMLAKMWTSLNPVFTVLNFTRDALTGTIHAANIGGPKFAAQVAKDVFPMMKGIWDVERNNDESTKNAKWYLQYQEDGGKTGFYMFGDMEDRISEINKLVANASNQGTTKQAWKGFKKAVIAIEDVVMDYNAIIENAIRVSSYKNAIQNGKTRAEASSIAKNLTVNFNRKGNWTPMLSSLFLFFNPAVQGTARMAQAAKNNPLSFGAVAGSLVALGILTALQGADDKDEEGVPYWDKVPSYEKNRSLVLMLPSGNRVTIPLPYGYGFFVNLGYAIADLWRGRPPTTVALDLLKSIGQHFNPLGTSEEPALMLMPTVLDPLFELAANKRATGQPLMPDEETLSGMPVPDSERFWPATRGTAIQKATEWLNEATGGTKSQEGAISISPETVRNFVRYYSGGVGTFLMDGVESAYVTQEIDFAAAREKNIVPFVRQIYKYDNVRSDVAYFYESKKKALAALDEAKKYYNTDRPDVLERIENERGIAQLGASIASMQRALRSLRLREIEIIENKDMSFADKNTERKELDDRKRGMLREWNAKFYEAEAESRGTP